MTAVALTGSYLASCAVFALPKSDVEKMLGSNCVLDPSQPLAPEGKHPIIVMLGDQRKVGPSFLPIAMNYHELTLAVPWVRRKGGSCGARPLAHVGRLWLDRAAPVVGGWAFGFPKILEDIRMSDESYEVRSLNSGRTLFAARFVVRGAAGSPDDLPNFARVRPIFEQPFLQRLFVFGPTCWLNMNFHIDRSTVQPIDFSLEVAPGAMPGLVERTYQAKSIEAEVLGAFRLEVPWSLSWPLRCRSL
jgi:hypothetical protein